MKFERESWRKLYVAESAEHRLMSVVARGLRDYLLRIAGDDGTLLASTKDAKQDVLRLLNPTSTEKRLVAEAFEELLRIGYLSLEGGRLWITKFVEAQASRSAGALRQERYKQRREGLASDEGVIDTVTESVTQSVTGDGAADAPLTLHLDETRRDETRRDPPKPPVEGGKRPKRAPVKSRIPEPFPLTSDHRLYASSKGWPAWWLENRHVAFVELAGSKGWIYADWDLALYGFLRREVEEYGRGPDALRHLAPRGEQLNPQARANRDRIQSNLAEQERQRQQELVATVKTTADPARGLRPLLAGIGGTDG